MDQDHILLEKKHAPSEDPFWQESWYFNFADPQADIYGLTRIAWRPSKGRADGLLLASVGGRPALLYPAVGKSLSSGIVSINPPDSLQTGGLKFECRAPMETWDLRLNTRKLELDLSFQAMTPMHLFPEVVTEDGKSAAASHYEQGGRVIGRIRHKGKTMAVNGWGQRDHSWGPRHWSGVGSWTWISGQFPSGWAFNYWHLGEGSPARTCGFIGNGKQNTDLVCGAVKTGKSKGLLLTLTPDGQTPREIGFQGATQWTLYKDGAIITENFGVFSCNGEQGAGVVERLYRPGFGLLSYLPHVPGMIARSLQTI